MHNQMTFSESLTGGLTGRLYYAGGELDRSSTAVTAYNDGKVALTLGPMHITLSAEAAAELAKHIKLAAEAAGGAK